MLEATSPTGELFGFERMNALFANRPTAQEAMKAAIDFGQEDDITVLTITRLAAGVQSSTSLSAPVLAPSPQRLRTSRGRMLTRSRLIERSGMCGGPRVLSTRPHLPFETRAFLPEGV